MPLVRAIAAKICRRLPANAEMAELVQAGLIGLNDALSRYAECAGASFDTYAARRIEGAILDSLRANDTLSRRTRARLREVQRAVQRLEHRLGRTPRAKEVANELGWPLERLHQCLVEAGADGVRSGDEALERAEEEAEPDAGIDDLPSSLREHAEPLQALQQRERHAALNAAFDALEDAERFTMESIYDHGLTLREIGEALGVSESRVSQMSAGIIAKLRARMEGQ